MSYRVVWRARVADGLELFAFLAYETGRDGGAVRRAAADIVARLGADPAAEGESRGGAERVLIVHPLSVVFEVFDEAGVVLIYSAVYYPRMRA